MASKKELIVTKIRNGTVIDHIPAGRALEVLKILKVNKQDRIALVMNVESKKMGKKDIIKIENKEVDEKEANLITLIAPTATINIIRDYEVVEKKKLKIPEVVKGIIKCTNLVCITNNDVEAVPVFIKISEKPLKMKCVYCDTVIDESEILKQILGSEK